MTYYDGADDVEWVPDEPDADPAAAKAMAAPQGLGHYDDPFEPLASPPASPTQPAADAQFRGNDYGGLTGDEYVKATEYAKSISARVQSKNSFLRGLSGSRTAYAALQGKTLPLAESSPPHYDGP